MQSIAKIQASVEYLQKQSINPPQTTADAGLSERLVRLLRVQVRKSWERTLENKKHFSHFTEEGWAETGQCAAEMATT